MKIQRPISLLLILLCIFTLSWLQLSQASHPTKNLDPSSPQYPDGLKTQFHKVKPGDTLIALLEQHGFNIHQRTEILKQKVFSENFTLIPGEKYRTASSKDNSFKELKFYEMPTNNILIFWRKSSLSGSLSRTETYTIKVKTARGRITGSILASINQHTRDDFVAQRFMDAYALDYKLTKEVQRGAKFAVTYEEKYDGNEFIGTGEVIETELEINGKNDKRQFVSYTDGGSFISAEYIHKDRPLYSPVSYQRITSQFNRRRFHPITKRRTPHLGVDFELPEGEDLYASAEGKVLRMGKNRAAGYYVVIRHGNGLESYYNHMQAINARIRNGSYIKNGQVIGKVGCTGYCTKPHLHFAIKKRGQFIDPIPFIKSYPYKEKALIAQHIEAFNDDGATSLKR